MRLLGDLRGLYSSSQGTYVTFEERKYDPDIQYVVGLYPIITGGIPSTLSALDTGGGVSAPPRLAATRVPPALPEPGVLILLFRGLALLAAVRVGGRV
jgi:hypothetical protein